jgi:hypothetical protein
VVQEIRIEVVNLEEDHVRLDFDRAKVVLAVGIIVGSEAVECADRCVDALDCLGPERLNSLCEDDGSAVMVFAQHIIERANALP